MERPSAICPGGGTPRRNPIVATQSGKRDSNPRPQPWQGCALPTELFPRRLLPGRSCCRHLMPRLDAGAGQPATSSAPGSGGEGNRTPDLLNAIQALSQLSYAPSAERRQPFRPETRSVARGNYHVKKIRLAKISQAGILQRLHLDSEADMQTSVGKRAVMNEIMRRESRRSR